MTIMMTADPSTAAGGTVTVIEDGTGIAMIGAVVPCATMMMTIVREAALASSCAVATRNCVSSVAMKSQPGPVWMRR